VRAIVPVRENVVVCRLDGDPVHEVGAAFAIEVADRADDEVSGINAIARTRIGEIEVLDAPSLGRIQQVCLHEVSDGPAVLAESQIEFELSDRNITFAHIGPPLASPHPSPSMTIHGQR
jgi:hypothetical protein